MRIPRYIIGSCGPGGVYELPVFKISPPIAAPTNECDIPLSSAARIESLHVNLCRGLVFYENDVVSIKFLQHLSEFLRNIPERPEIIYDHVHVTWETISLFGGVVEFPTYDHGFMRWVGRLMIDVQNHSCINQTR